MMKTIHFLSVLWLSLCMAACTSSKPTESSALQFADTLQYSIADKALFDSIDVLPGIIHAASGLRYQILTSAEGRIPSDSDTICVAYRGLHADGSPFWEADGEEFVLAGTIKGFHEGVGMMATGATYKLYIPSALGYGHKGYPELIQPDEPLIYEVTLKSFH
jgi:FKBP-type peptidyl-prolyl cis-trans isomerase